MKEDQRSERDAQALHTAAAELRRQGDLAGARRKFAELASGFGEAADVEDAFQAGIARIELSDFAMRDRDDRQALVDAEAAWAIGARLDLGGEQAGGFLVLHGGARRARALLALGDGGAALEALVETHVRLGARREDVPQELAPAARSVALTLIDHEGLNAVGPLLEELVHFSTGRPPPAESQAREALGDAMTAAGKEQAAMGAYRAALTAWPSGSPAEELARAALMSKAGLCADRLGELATAAQLYEGVLQIRERELPPDHIDRIRARYNVAELARYSGGGLEHAAVELAAVVSALRAQPGADRDLLVLALKNLAQARIAQSRPEAAEPLVREALGLTEEGGHRRAQLLVTLGRVQREQGREPDVGPELDRLARQLLAEQGASSLDYLWTLESAASFMPPDDPEALERTNEQVLRSVGEPESSAERDLVVMASLNLALARWMRGEYQSALDLFRDASKQQERAKAETWRIRSALETSGDDPLPIAGLVIELVLRQLTDDDAARRFAFRIGTGSKRLQAEALRRQRELVLEGDDELLDLQALASRLRVQQAVGGPDTESAEQLAELDAMLAGRLRPAAILDALECSDAAAVGAALPSASVLVEYVRCRAFTSHADAPSAPERDADWYVAFVLPANHPERLALVDLGPAEPIDDAVRQLRAAIAPSEGDPRDWRAPARAAAALVWDPVAPLVGIDATVVVAPDGQIGALPFDVLVGADGHPLLMLHVFAYIGTGRDARLLGSRPNWSSAAPAVLGAPEFGEPWAPFVPLPGTQREAKAVGRLLGADPQTGAAATRERLLTVEDPEILHLATHGYYLSATAAEGPLGARLTALAAKGPLLATGIALADANRVVSGASGGDAGVVSALDVLGLQLYGTDLVVLSACDSGLGVLDDGEGLISLARSFALAGARSVVWTLWRVDDWATAALMEGFYRRLLNATSRAVALYRAKRDLLASHPDRPDIWSGFVLQGDPLALLRHRSLMPPAAQVGERTVLEKDGVTYLDQGRRLFASFGVPFGDDVLTVGSIDVTGIGVAAGEDEQARAALAFREGRYDDAVAGLSKALQGLDPGSPSGRQLAARLRSQLAVAYGYLGDAQQALEQGLGAVAAYEALGDWPLELGQALDNVAAAEVALGHPEEARAHYQRALGIKRDERPAGHPSIDFTQARLQELDEKDA